MVGIIIAASFLFPGCAEAATTNTLREKYNLQLLPDANPLRAELLRLQLSIRTAQEIELYNRVIAETSTETIGTRIETLTKQVETLYLEVLNGIDLSLDTLLKKEEQYKTAVVELSELLHLRDYYNFDQIPPPDTDLGELEAKVTSLQTVIKEAGIHKDIGKLDYYPIKGHTYKVNSPFGSRYDPVGIRGLSFHYGIDLAAPEDTPIGAWFSGTVLSVGTSYGSGNYVWLDHGQGVRTFYCHLNRVEVAEGQSVKQGAIIALSGNTGAYTTGPHLHLALYISGVAVNPGVILS
jgi:murein DD-endopeptidase MepM/ murein hydrolase activator NlpD